MTTQTIEPTQSTAVRLAEAKDTLRQLDERKSLLPGAYRQAVARDEASTMATLRADLEGIDVQIQLAAIAVADAEIAHLDEQDAEQGPRIAACGPHIGEAQQAITRALQAHREALQQYQQALGALRRGGAHAAPGRQLVGAAPNKKQDVDRFDVPSSRRRDTGRPR